jgi:parallel beta-helix repeat protein
LFYNTFLSLTGWGGVKIFRTLILSTLLLTGIALAIPLGVSHAQPPAVIFVSTTGSDILGNGSPASPYATISHAVIVAPAGAEILVEPGTYNEMVNFSKPVDILSTSGEPTNTIINAAGLAHGIEILGASASGSGIEGFTVENANEEGIYVQDANNVIITNNHVLDNSQDTSLVCPFAPPLTVPKCILEDKAIELIGTAGSTVASNYVVGTVGDGGIGLSDDGSLNPGAPCALDLTTGACPGGPGGASNPSMDNVVTGNTVIANTGGCGIVVSAYNPGEGVIGNVVANNNDVANAEGIVVATPVPGTSATNNTVIGNSVTNAFTEGIDIDFSTSAFAPGGSFNGNSVIDNVLSGNGPDGDFHNPQPTGIAVISPTSDVVQNTAVVGNTIRNEYYGIGVFNATGTVIQSNTMDPSVVLPLTGASVTPSQVTVVSGEVSSLQASITALEGTVSQLQSNSATVSALSALSSTVTSLQSSLTQLQNSAASASQVSAASTTANNASSQAQTATDLGYAAIAIAVVFGGIAIALAMRKPSSK